MPAAPDHTSLRGPERRRKREKDAAAVRHRTLEYPVRTGCIEVWTPVSVAAKLVARRMSDVADVMCAGERRNDGSSR